METKQSPASLTARPLAMSQQRDRVRPVDNNMSIAREEIFSQS